MFDPAEPAPSSKSMCKLFTRLVIPAIFTNVMAFVSVVINAVFAGRTNDPSKLAAVGLANVCHSVMILSLLIGLNAAQETLTSQAFGNGNLRLCGVYLNRGRLILVVFFIPLALVPAIFAEDILLSIGQDAEVSRLTNIQIWAGLPAIFCYGQYDLYKRWLACMRITFVPMVAMCIATCMHLPFCLLFMNTFGLGIVGLAVASSCRDFILLVALMIYGNCKTEIRDTLQPFWSRETFRGWGEYLKVSLPSTVMICAEWWGF